MIQIKELNNTNKEYIGKIALLHKKSFPKFFLTQLGRSFLCALYTGYLEDETSGIIVAEEEEKLLGFIAFSNDYPLFYKNLIKNHFVKFALCSILAVAKHPSFTKRILGAFKKSESVTKNEQYVELASICVDPMIENQGVGTQLIDYLKGIVDFNKYAYINLETDADNNDAVNLFYEKNGFRIIRQYVTAENRHMNEYRFFPEVSI